MGRLLGALAWMPCLLIAAPLEWEQGEGHRSAALSVDGAGAPGFTAMSVSRTGVDFTNVLAEARHLRNNTLLSGSGVAAGDVDGDGLCDLFFAALDRDCRLYRNLGGWKFEDITAEAGVALTGRDVTGAALADFDGDGDLDLIVNNVGSGTHVFYNDGQGRFQRVSPADGLNPGAAGMSMALADIDGDHYLDLYIANYRVRMLMDMPGTVFEFATVDGKTTIAKVNGHPTTHPELTNRFVISESGRILDTGEPDLFFQNLGGTNVRSLLPRNGHFFDEKGQRMTEPLRDFGLSVAFRDINRDGRPDLYVCNDFNSPDRIWINQDQLRFQLINPLQLRHTSYFSMGIDFADINRDGLEDFIVLDMQSQDHKVRMDITNPELLMPEQARQVRARPQYMFNTLFLGREEGAHAEIAHLAGLAATEWSWTPVFLDVDLDGWEDLLVSNGYVREARSEDTQKKLNALRQGREMTPDEVFENRKLYPSYLTPNLAYRNLGQLRFQDRSQAWGFDEPGMTHGMALADLDNDGDLDLAVNHLNQPATLFRNNAPAPRVAVRLRGANANTRGIGARITLQGGPVTQSQELACGGRFLSSDQPMRVFAAGANATNLALEVAWPDGRMSRLTSVRPNRVYEVFQADAQPQDAAAPAYQRPLFQDISRHLPHEHHEDAFDDFARQPLLPHQLSRMGPGLVWADLDQDGWDDLAIGSGHGGRPGLYRNRNGKGFEPYQDGELPVASGDQVGLLAVPVPGKGSRLLAAHSPWADGAGSAGAIRTLSFGEASPWPDLALPDTSPGPMALADVDQDGDLDLFVGGAFIPGSYPQPATSRLWLQDEGTFRSDAGQLRDFEKLGLVRGAVFSDLDNDGDPDLALACEWGPVRVLLNEAGVLQDHTAQLGLQSYLGWWTGITTGDFNGDGRQDIVAANWGRNSAYELYFEEKLELYYGDFDGNGVVDMVEAYPDATLGRVVPQNRLDHLARGLPDLPFRFTSNKAYSEAALPEILNRPLAEVGHLKATWLESTVFLNSPTGFVARPLPVEAQFAPAFGISTADANGDGHEDLFLSQNFFATRPDMPRNDAGLGLWLRGNGEGSFEALDPKVSGVLIHGEQRGCAVADFNRDGRVDLAVAQNGEATRLYRNVGAEPGLLVRLEGPPGNPTGIGAVLRVGDDSRWGPAREIHAGSGYASQPGAGQVLGRVGKTARLQVRWPGQAVRVLELPAGAREVVVPWNGELNVVR